MRVLLTGVAGFIGSHLARKLLEDGVDVVGVDNLNDYYDVRLKKDRLARLKYDANFSFIQADISDERAILGLVNRLDEVTHIVHLAAQAGVRYSLENPYIYADTNVRGQIVMLELARRLPHLQHFVYASSSSVYGRSTDYPLSLSDRCDVPRSIYAATKRACEHLAYSYGDTYGLKATGLRFFTVYGPWGRPDMAAWLFTKAILADDPITVFNFGHMERDFTFVDDIVAGTHAVMKHLPVGDAHGVPHAVYNLGNSRPNPLMDMIGILETVLERKARINFAPMQAGDVQKTFADISQSAQDFGFEPHTPLEIGLPQFVSWYRDYHKV